MDKITTLQSVALLLGDRGEKPALYEFRKGDLKIWTFAELDDQSRRLAAGLVEAGLRTGSHAILFAPNRAEWVIACFALLRAGIVPVPIDAQTSGEALGAAVEQSQADWIFSSADLAERVRDATSGRKHELILLDGGDEEQRAWTHFLSDKRFDPSPVKPEERAVLFFTSGTSGKPKGVPLTHHNVVSNLFALLKLNLIQDDDRVLLPLPLHHVYPFTVGMLAPLALGVPIVLPYLLTGPQLQRALLEGRASAIIGVPGLYDAFYEAVENRIKQRSRFLLSMFHGVLAFAVAAHRYLGCRLGESIFAPLRRRIAPDLRVLASGGSAMDTDLAWRLKALGWRVLTGYGLTETSPILTFNGPGQQRVGTAGKPLAGIDVRIGESEPNARYGEVLVKGPNVFSGYLGDTKKDSEVFTAEGYFRTGDLGSIDEDGYLSLAGRISSMILLSSGENIWPERIEQALERSELIQEAGVFAKDDRLAAVLVTEIAADKKTGDADEEEVIRREVEKYSAALPSHHRVADFAMIAGSLPRTRLGKLQRHKLSELFERARISNGSNEKKRSALVSDLEPKDQNLLQEPAVRKIWDWLVERFKDIQMAPELSMQRDLGIESMDWLHLTLEIRQRAGVDLDDDAIGRIQTVRDLLREIAESGAIQDYDEDAAQLLERPHELLSDRQRKWLQPPGVMKKLVGNLLLGVNRLLMHRGFRLEVRGIENLPDSQSFIVAPNHTSLLDPLAVGAALPPKQLRRTYWGGWTGIMFKNSIMRLISGALRVVPIDPEGGPLSPLAFGIAALKANKNLVWFPEGGRSTDGKLQRFRPGIGMLLTNESVPVIPAYIHGTYHAFPPGRRWPRLRKISVTFGRPFHANRKPSDRPREKTHQTIADDLREQVDALARNFHP